MCKQSGIKSRNNLTYNPKQTGSRGVNHGAHWKAKGKLGGMSKFSFTTKSSTNLSKSSSNAPAEYILPTPRVPVPASLAAPSTWQPPPRWNLNNSNAMPKRSNKSKNRTVEEEKITRDTTARFAACLALDHIAVLYPEVDSPFMDKIDVVNRLLPYHVFQHPKADLDGLLKGGKRKEKFADNHLFKEIKDTKFALECFKRRKKLQDRFRRARLKSGTRSAPDYQAYVLAQAALEADRHETTSLNTEVRNARMEIERIEREKRLASIPSRPTYYSRPAAPQPQYYGGYSYAYAQPYGTSLQPLPPPSSVHMYPVPASTAPTVYGPPPSSVAIPVQLPVASLPALHALGIVPIPVSSLPPSNQPQPPAVLRGSTASGTMLSLEINVSLLQSAQMSGLAMVLNSLMSRGVTANASNIATSLGPMFGGGGATGNGSVGTEQG